MPNFLQLMHELKNPQTPRGDRLPPRRERRAEERAIVKRAIRMIAQAKAQGRRLTPRAALNQIFLQDLKKEKA